MVSSNSVVYQTIQELHRQVLRNSDTHSNCGGEYYHCSHDLSSFNSPSVSRLLRLYATGAISFLHVTLQLLRDVLANWNWIHRQPMWIQLLHINPGLCLPNIASNSRHQQFNWSVSVTVASDLFLLFAATATSVWIIKGILLIAPAINMISLLLLLPLPFLILRFLSPSLSSSLSSPSFRS
jgi:hypothetical protein